MKKLSLLLIFILISCHSAKKTNHLVNDKSMINNVQCPENGTCSLTVSKLKSINVKSDEFGNSYTEIIDSNNTLLIFEYKRDPIENVVDDNYQELVYIELQNPIENLRLENDQLQNAKVTFVRLCFCKGQTGAYKVTNGQLDITKRKTSNYQLELSFEVDEVPHIINTISREFSL